MVLEPVRNVTVAQTKRTRASSVGAASLAILVGLMHQVSVHILELLGPGGGVPPRIRLGDLRMIKNLPGMVPLVLGAIIGILSLNIIVEGFVLVARLTDIDPLMAVAGVLREIAAADRGVVILSAAPPHTVAIALAIIAPHRAVISTVGQFMSIIATTITGLLVAIMEDVLTMDRTIGLVLTLKLISQEKMTELRQLQADVSTHVALLLHTRVVIRRLRIILSGAAPVLVSLVLKRSLQNPILAVLVPQCTTENHIPTVVTLRRIRETPCALALTSHT